MVVHDDQTGSFGCLMSIGDERQLRAAHDKLQEAVAEIVSGDGWKRMLKVSTNFQRYSFNNHLMIFCQRPDATLVAGFQSGSR